jgi:xylulokinase
MAESTAGVFRETDVTPDQVGGISFCSQMQGLVLVDRDGVPVHRPMSYMDQRAKEELKKGISLGRFGEPEEVAELVAFLASDGAAYITGETIAITGGLKG